MREGVEEREGEGEGEGEVACKEEGKGGESSNLSTLMTMEESRGVFFHVRGSKIIFLTAVSPSVVDVVVVVVVFFDPNPEIHLCISL